jgi:hypothetical protein
MHLEGDESGKIVPDAFLCLAARPSAFIASGGNGTQPESRSLPEIAWSGKPKVTIMRFELDSGAGPAAMVSARGCSPDQPGLAKGWISQIGSRMP